jgi:hypothetical protein
MALGHSPAAKRALPSLLTARMLDLCRQVAAFFEQGQRVRTVILPAEMRAFYAAVQKSQPRWLRGTELAGFGASVFQEIKRTWVPHPDRKLHWDWWVWHGNFARSPDRFEAVVRLDGTLLGLILGEHRAATIGEGARLEVAYLEGKPGDHPLKGQMLPLLLDIAYYYAHVRHGTEVRLFDPAPGLITLYHALGYVLDSSTAHPMFCSKMLKKD